MFVPITSHLSLPTSKNTVPYFWDLLGWLPQYPQDLVHCRQPVTAFWANRETCCLGVRLVGVPLRCGVAVGRRFTLESHSHRGDSLSAGCGWPAPALTTIGKHSVRHLSACTSEWLLLVRFSSSLSASSNPSFPVRSLLECVPCVPTKHTILFLSQHALFPAPATFFWQSREQRCVPGSMNSPLLTGLWSGPL